MGSVLLSLSFAVGPSAAKVVEGMIMIAVRRYVHIFSSCHYLSSMMEACYLPQRHASPFDLGDKISIIGSASDPPSDCDPGHQVMWIVEDWYVHIPMDCI